MSQQTALDHSGRLITDCSAQEFSMVISVLQVVTDYANGDIAAHEVSGDATTIYRRP